MIKCVAIDDEPIALEIIKEYCKRSGDLSVECFSSPVKGMEYINESHPDIVFLDIELNSYNGIELAKKLPLGGCLIFTTAYADYAMDGFDADAVDFLHKPIFYPRFERAVNKARRFLGITNDEGPQVSGSIMVKEGYKNVILSTKDIILIEAMDNYVKIYRKNLPTVVPQITMKEMERLLPAEKFARIHRSYIVAIGEVEKYSNKAVWLHDCNNPIPIGRKYIDKFQKLYNLIKSL